MVGRWVRFGVTVAAVVLPSVATASPHDDHTHAPPQGDDLVQVMTQFFGSPTANNTTAPHSHRPSTSATALSLEQAHAAAHNWLSLDGEGTQWFSEGSADYYPLALAYGSGLLEPDDFLGTVNARASAYYTSPYTAQPNSRLGDIPMDSHERWTLPAGRGLIYMLNVNAQIREASGGTRSLNDVVLVIAAQKRAGQSVTTSDWQAMLEHEIGPQALSDFQRMNSGELVVPRHDTLSPCYHTVAVDFALADGQTIKGWQWEPVRDANRYGCGTEDDGHAHE